MSQYQIVRMVLVAAGGTIVGWLSAWMHVDWWYWVPAAAALGFLMALLTYRQSEEGE